MLPDLENCIRFEISAEFYSILVYHMSKSDENWPIYKNLRFEKLVKGKYDDVGAARYVRNDGDGGDGGARSEKKIKK